MSRCNVGLESDSQLVVIAVNEDIPVPWSHRIGGEAARFFIEVLALSEWPMF